ncbi:MupG family TIM beta-alpha barrel fold protein [Selenomonas sp. TAMA-11512]|uniref:MupG family TIM beta-alpha barrel fold protein n=1 Tax=Selenomonas sp. TAMA-11512 TaxID=3095337 RepID=UPI003091DDC2|nr:MupG family TIM beta-alpha barrel fold protein [Selenomonas sp. TAMA-11512]
MKTGISIYPGVDNTSEENLRLLDSAAHLGISRLFISCNTNLKNFDDSKEIFSKVVQRARQLNFEIILDMTDSLLSLFSMRTLSLSAFQFLGIHTLRMPYDYNAKEIASLSHNTQGIRIGLHASSVSGRFLGELLDAKADFDNIDAFHSAYAHEGTGLSESTLVRKTAMLHKAGIHVSAFIPSQERRRSPLRRGMPTLEMHRDISLSLAARHMAAVGLDSVFIGDSLPSKDELTTITSIKPNLIVLRAQLLQEDSIQNELLHQTYTARLDEARDAVRAVESKQYIQEQSLVIEPTEPHVRPYGSVTIDNKNYGEYMGELQILKRPLPADPRVNIAAHIPEEEQFLINYIIPGKKFSFLIQ